MNATWSLFKIFRRRLVILMAIEAILVFLMAAHDIRPQDPTSVTNDLGGSFMLALFLSLGMQIQMCLNATPFPVTPRQRIWLPVMSVTAIWITGLLCILVAMVCVGMSVEHGFVVMVELFRRLPFYVWVTLIAYRLWLVRFWMVFFIVILLPMSLSQGTWLLNVSVSLPLVIVTASLYFIEVPHQLACRDRHFTGQHKFYPFIAQRDLTINSRQMIITWIGNTLDAGLILAYFAGIFVFWWWQTLKNPTPLEWPIRVIYWLLLGFCLFWAVTCIREIHRATIASGFRSYQAFGLTALQSTIILGPLAQALGVKKGVVARCDQCHRYKFIWAQHCPHCGFPGPGTIVNKKMASLARGRPLGGPLRQRIAMRLMIPLQCLFIFGFVGMPGSRPFITHPVHLSFADAQTAQAAAITIQNWIKNHADADVWLSTAEHPVQSPKKYRLNVQYTEGQNYMIIRDYSLRWDTAAALPKLLAEELNRLLPKDNSFTAKPGKEMQAVSPFGECRTFLDNQIHWKEDIPSHRHDKDVPPSPASSSTSREKPPKIRSALPNNVIDKHPLS